MTLKRDRNVLVHVLGELGKLDAEFEVLEGEERELTFHSNPSHQQGDVVLLGGYGKRGSGDLYAFVGMLTGCKHRGKSLKYSKVERFWCPVVAVHGRFQRTDLTGQRGAWGPHEFNYVLPAALTKVPKEAKALLSHDPRKL